jgi:formylglycine-generating enzyme required for sulfatase activity
MHAEAAKRLALVVGNDSYRLIGPLRNARADAKAVARALESAGFEVTVKTDLGKDALKAALRNFKAKVEGGDDAVFYFSGHGVQFGAANYLLPVDIEDENEDQVKDDALPLQRVLDDLSDQKARFTLAIVDACRNNPFKTKGKSLGGKGLMPVNPATGQMVLYAAGAGQEALDRLSGNDNDPNGLFTRVLLKEMNRPNMPVDRVLRNVRDQVVKLAKNVNHDQVPALYDQTIGDFYFKRGAAEPTSAEVFAQPTAAPAARRQPVREEAEGPDNSVEASYWAEVRKSDDTDSYAAYLSTYPNGLHVADANEYIERDKRNKEAKAKLKEDQAWKAAQNGNSYASYSAYLKSYPNGRYVPLAQLKVKKLEPAHPPGTAFRDCPDCPEMVVIPAGSFTMGSPGGEEGRKDREGPLHRVSLDGFALGKYEVSVGEFRRFVEASGYRTDAERNADAGGTAQGCYAMDPTDGKWGWRAGRYWDSPGFTQSERHPAVCISWNDATAYVKWLAQSTGKAYRLPSESEWEYSVRAGSSTARPWGDDPDQACRYANVADQSKSPNGITFNPKHECNDGTFYTATVGSYLANGFGLHDMIGNAWEWTEDCWNENYSGAPSDGSAWTSGNCVARVLRGGSWNYFPTGARSAYRIGVDTTGRDNDYGFRPARIVLP